MLLIQTIATRTAATYLIVRPWRCDAFEVAICCGMLVGFAYWCTCQVRAGLIRAISGQQLAHLVVSLVRARCRSIMSCDNRHTSVDSAKRS